MCIHDPVVKTIELIKSVLGNIACTSQPCITNCILSLGKTQYAHSEADHLRGKNTGDGDHTLES